MMGEANKSTLLTKEGWHRASDDGVVLSSVHRIFGKLFTGIKGMKEMFKLIPFIPSIPVKWLYLCCLIGRIDKCKRL
jgi:hypothetical protein